MKYTLPNGAIIEGTPDQIAAVAKSLGHTVNFRGMYHSDTHGLIEIRTMDTRHVRNALLKKYREWVSNLSSITDNRELLTAMRNGPRDDEFIDLLTALAQRGI